MLFVCVQPVAATHPSVVQTLLSIQSLAEVSVPAHVPPPQTSPVVHALPSLHEAVLFVCVQPVAATHPSVVQTLLSLQSLAEVSVPAHVPPPQTSPVVHALPSLHEPVLFVCVQPLAATHPPFAPLFWSLQSLAEVSVPAHVPPPQTSPVVHALPSLHEPVLFVCVQPVAG